MISAVVVSFASCGGLGSLGKGDDDKDKSDIPSSIGGMVGTWKSSSGGVLTVKSDGSVTIRLGDDYIEGTITDNLLICGAYKSMPSGLIRGAAILRPLDDGSTALYIGLNKTHIFDGDYARQ